MMENPRVGSQSHARPERASEVSGLSPRQSDRYAIIAMGNVAASIGRKKKTTNSDL